MEFYDRIEIGNWKLSHHLVVVAKFESLGDSLVSNPYEEKYGNKIMVQDKPAAVLKIFKPINQNSSDQYGPCHHSSRVILTG